MSVYVNKYDEQLQRASVTVHEHTRAVRVTYHNEQGQRFRLDFVQKPNPIGFHARLPGEKR